MHTSVNLELQLRNLTLALSPRSRCRHLLPLIILVTMMLGINNDALATDPSHLFDYDHDGKTDLAVYRPSNGVWYVRRSSDGTVTVLTVGSLEDSIVPGDYDGDGKSDRAVFVPDDGTEGGTNYWRIWPTADPTNALFNQFGLNADLKVPRDYTGDGATDLAVVRPETSNLIWYIRKRPDNSTVRIVTFGLLTDHIAPGDYNGDGKSDVAVYRPSNSTWYIQLGTDEQPNIVSQQFGSGFVGAQLPAEDYDGDGKADCAAVVKNQSADTTTWNILQSSNAATRTVAWGLFDDIAVSGDYDGDTITDVAVWRPSTGVWYILQSSTGTLRAETFGQDGDMPIPVIKLG